MEPLRTALWVLTAVAALGLSVRAGPATPRGGEPIATVNGAALTEADLTLRLKPDHQRDAPPPEQLAARRKAVLETLISDELTAQRAKELGLDADPEYLAGLAPLQAQVDAYRRKALSDRFAQHALTHDGAVTDAEARKFFEAERPKLQRQVQVWQILKRSEAAIVQAQAELAQAPSFEAYARSQFPQLAETERPWDLGYLRWEQLPEAWRDVVYGMKKGEVSAVIQGEKDRYWILRLADVRETPEVTFESVKPTLLEALKAKKLGQLEQSKRAELRAQATVVYTR